MTQAIAGSRRPLWPWLVGIAWLALAASVGAAGVMARLRPPAPQLVLVGLTVALVVAHRVSPGVRAWTDGLDLRAVPAFHLTRFVGFYFLALYARGELPGAFAMPAGIGDIIVAVGALLLLLAVGRPHTRTARRLYRVWNAVGLVDILFVVFRAARLALEEPASMTALLRLPLSLLLTFIVPVIIASHLLLFRRLRAPVLEGP
jgi:hypothetical protein